MKSKKKESVESSPEKSIFEISGDGDQYIPK